MGEAIVNLLPDGTIEYSNQQFSEFLNNETDQIAGSSFKDFFPAEEQSKLADFLSTSGEEVVSGIFHLNPSDRSPIPVQLAIHHLNSIDQVTQLILVTDLSGQKENSQDNLFQNRTMNQVFQSLIDGILVVDLEGVIINVNPAAERILGVTKDQFVGINFLDHGWKHLDKNGQPLSLEELPLAVAMRERKNVTEFEDGVVAPDGKVKWLSVNASPLLNDQGMLFGAIASFRDISEKRNSESRLRKLNEQIAFQSLLLNQVRNAVIATDLGGKIVYWNKFAEVIYQWKSDEVLGKNIHDITVPEIERAESYAIMESIQRDGYWEGEFLVSRKDGEIFPVYVVDTLIRDGLGKAIGIAGVSQDISERKNSLKALEEERYLLLTLMESTPDTIYFKNLDGQFIRLNKAQADMLGIENPLDALGKTDFDFFSEEFAKESSADEQTIIHSEKPLISKDEKINRQDGKSVWFSSTKMPFRNQAGEIIGVFGISREITDQKMAEEKLRESEEKFKTLFDSANDAILTMQGGIFLDCNTVSERIFGTSKDNIIGHSPLNFSPEFQSDGTRSEIQADRNLELALSGEPQRFEWIHRRPDGSTFFAEVSLNRVLYKDDFILQAIVRDISERKQAEAEIQLRTMEIESLYELSHSLADANDLNQIANTITRYSVENTQKTFARLALLTGNDLEIHSTKSIRMVTHPLNSVDTLPLTSIPLCRSILEGNEAKVISSDYQEINHDERAFLLLDYVNSLYLVPLRAGFSGSNYSQPLGILMVGEARSEEREPQSNRMLLRIQSMADQASSAIRRMLLKEETDRHLQFLNSLDDIDRAITSSFDMHTSLKIVLSTIRKQLNVDATNVLILNSTSRFLEYFIGEGFRTHAVDQTRLRIGESHAGKAALSQSIIHISDLKDPNNYLKTINLSDENFCEYYGVPLITKGQVKGVLEIFNRNRIRTSEEWFGNLNTLAERAAIAIENSLMFQDVSRTNIDLTLAYDQTIEGWSNALDLRDHETEGHSFRVTENALELATACAYPKEDLMQFRWGALLHDIGKMGIPDNILLKPGPLTDEEWLAMKEHPSLAFKMLSHIQYLRLAVDIPYCHHEKWDGSGYPRGLKGEQIPLAARIFSVVDVWDALSSDRPYRPAWKEEKVLQYIQEQAGLYFDPQIVKKFINIKVLGRLNKGTGRAN